MTLTILITGATSGIGKVAAKKLFDLGHNVIITGRSEASLDAAEEFITTDSTAGKLYRTVMFLDDFGSIKQCVENIKSFVPHLDVIFHNASMKNSEFIQFCDNKVEGTIFVNAVAPLYLNQLLMPLVENSTSSNRRRILFVTSTLHDPEIPIIPGQERTDIPKSVQLSDLVGNPETWKSSPFYSLSKIATVWNAFALAEINPSISVTTFCPGFVPTTGLNRTESEEVRSFIRNVATKFVRVTTEEQSADEYVYYATDPEINNLSGSYFRYTEVVQCSKDGADKEKQDAYWKFANEMIEIHLRNATSA